MGKKQGALIYFEGTTIHCLEPDTRLSLLNVSPRLKRRSDMETSFVYDRKPLRNRNGDFIIHSRPSR